ncbi:MAG: GGDEF domain-containing protein [Myxococcales bacterium]|nr:GGDEF domain-containing protein [Myxococcales bacterium]
MARTDHLDAETRITSVREIAARGASRNACLVQLRGPQMGSRLELGEAEFSIGRDEGNDIVLESDSVSRRHAKIESTDIGHRIVDNFSTNGTYLNEVLVQEKADLRSSDYIQIGEAIFKYLSGDNIEVAYHEEIYRLTIEDGLTQVPNKRALTDFLDREFSRARRYQRGLAVVMCDLDHFKAVNDDFGHLMGDYVLREVAKLAKARIRHEELFARYGGEEFCAVLPEVDEAGARSFAEDFRILVQEHVFEFEGNKVDVTVSVGFALADESMTRPEALLLKADENLYRAKNAGRNQVVG